MEAVENIGCPIDYLQINDIKTGRGRARHLLHPQLAALFPFPRTNALASDASRVGINNPLGAGRTHRGGRMEFRISSVVAPACSLLLSSPDALVGDAPGLCFSLCATPVFDTSTGLSYLTSDCVGWIITLCLQIWRRQEFLPPSFMALCLRHRSAMAACFRKRVNVSKGIARCGKFHDGRSSSRPRQSSFE